MLVQVNKEQFDDGVESFGSITITLLTWSYRYSEFGSATIGFQNVNAAVTDQIAITF